MRRQYITSSNGERVDITPLPRYLRYCVKHSGVPWRRRTLTEWICHRIVERAKKP